MENERLQQRLVELRKYAYKLPSMPSSSSMPSSYGPTSMQTPRSYPAPIIVPDTPAGYHPTSAAGAGGPSTIIPSPVTSTLDDSNVNTYAAMFGGTPSMDEDVSEDGLRKKVELSVLRSVTSLTIYYAAQKDACQ
jgi:hypothetical protein